MSLFDLLKKKKEQPKLVKANAQVAPSQEVIFISTQGIRALSAEEILGDPKVAELLGQCSFALGGGQELYEHFLKPSIKQFAYHVQLLPASEPLDTRTKSSTGHHAFKGGLLIHTLEVINFALIACREKFVNLNINPADRGRKESAYRLAAALVSLVHDAGKINDLLVVTYLDHDRKHKVYWNGLDPLPEFLAKAHKCPLEKVLSPQGPRYEIEGWRSKRTKKHEIVGNFFIRFFVSKQSLSFIADTDPDLYFMFLSQIVWSNLVTTDLEFESNKHILNEIVTLADRHSSLTEGVSPVVHFDGEMLSACVKILKQSLESGNLPINKGSFDTMISSCEENGKLRLFLRFDALLEATYLKAWIGEINTELKVSLLPPEYSTLDNFYKLLVKLKLIYDHQLKLEPVNLRLKTDSERELYLNTYHAQNFPEMGVDPVYKKIVDALDLQSFTAIEFKDPQIFLPENSPLMKNDKVRTGLLKNRLFKIEIIKGAENKTQESQDLPQTLYSIEVEEPQDSQKAQVTPPAPQEKTPSAKSVSEHDKAQDKDKAQAKAPLSLKNPALKDPAPVAKSSKKTADPAQNPPQAKAQDLNDHLPAHDLQKPFVPKESAKAPKAPVAESKPSGTPQENLKADIKEDNLKAQASPSQDKLKGDTQNVSPQASSFKPLEESKPQESANKPYESGTAQAPKEDPQKAQTPLFENPKAHIGSSKAQEELPKGKESKTLQDDLAQKALQEPLNLAQNEGLTVKDIPQDKILAHAQAETSYQKAQDPAPLKQDKSPKLLNIRPNSQDLLKNLAVNVKNNHDDTKAQDKLKSLLKTNLKAQEKKASKKAQEQTKLKAKLAVSSELLSYTAQERNVAVDHLNKQLPVEQAEKIINSPHLFEGQIKLQREYNGLTPYSLPFKCHNRLDATLKKYLEHNLDYDLDKDGFRPYNGKFKFSNLPKIAHLEGNERTNALIEDLAQNLSEKVRKTFISLMKRRVYTKQGIIDLVFARSKEHTFACLYDGHVNLTPKEYAALDAKTKEMYEHQKLEFKTLLSDPLLFPKEDLKSLNLHQLKLFGFRPLPFAVAFLLLNLGVEPRELSVTHSLMRKPDDKAPTHSELVDYIFYQLYFAKGGEQIAGCMVKEDPDNGSLYLSNKALTNLAHEYHLNVKEQHLKEALKRAKARHPPYLILKNRRFYVFENPQVGAR